MDQQESPDLTVVVWAHVAGGLGGGGVGELSTHSTCRRHALFIIGPHTNPYLKSKNSHVPPWKWTFRQRTVDLSRHAMNP